jgi:hypothetical protein
VQHEVRRRVSSILPQGLVIDGEFLGIVGQNGYEAAVLDGDTMRQKLLLLFKDKKGISFCFAPTKLFASI